MNTKLNIAKKHFATVCFLTILSACGGGSSSTGSGGSPELTSKCSVSNMSVSSGTQATLSKSNSQLSATMQLALQQASSIDINSNFESKDADDWIEGMPYIKNLAAGTHSITVQYNLNSPKKSASDRYTKLSVTVNLPNGEACVANLAVNITLNP